MPLPSSRHTKLWLALLHELEEAGGSANPKGIIPKMDAYFPDIAETDLTLANADGTNLWRNRIQWARQHLVDEGFIDKSQYGVWKISADGKAWLETYWTGPDSSYADVPKPSKKTAVREPTISPSPQPAAAANQPESTQGAPLALVSPTDAICQQITQSQRQSNTPQAFEQGLVSALSKLGFEASHIGGPGDTDILIRAPLGQSTYTAVIDAKSSHSGKITDNQINWPAIVGHQQSHQADYAAIIGESFGGGNLLKYADQYKVVLITTSMVCDLLNLNAAAPFTLIELRTLFRNPGAAQDAISALRESHNRRIRHWRLIADVVETISKLQAVATNGLKPDQLYPLLWHQGVTNKKELSELPTPQDVSDAMALLANHALGILAEVPGSGGAYQLTMTVDTARRIARTFARSLEASGQNGASPISEAITGKA